MEIYTRVKMSKTSAKNAGKQALYVELAVNYFNTSKGKMVWTPVS